jgi:hypothetical protein
VETIEDQQVRLSRRGQAAIRELRKARALQDEIKERIKRHEDVLKTELSDGLPLGGKRVGTVGGLPVCSIKSTIRNTVNMAMLRKRAPEIVAECTVETEVKTFAILGE